MPPCGRGNRGNLGRGEARFAGCRNGTSLAHHLRDRVLQLLGGQSAVGDALRLEARAIGRRSRGAVVRMAAGKVFHRKVRNGQTGHRETTTVMPKFLRLSVI